MAQDQAATGEGGIHRIARSSMPWIAFGTRRGHHLERVAEERDELPRAGLAEGAVWPAGIDQLADSRDR